METAVAEVEHVVKLMYGGIPTASPQDQQGAINWLLAFGDSNSAWTIYPHLLRSSDPVVKFYAGNGLYSKVRASWHRLQPAQRAEVENHLWSGLDAAVDMDVGVLGRLVLAITTATVLSAANGSVPACVMRVAGSVRSLLAQPAGQPGSSRDILLCVCMQLLLELHDISNELQLSSKQRNAIERDFGAAAAGILEMCGAILSQPSSPFAVAAVCGADPVTHQVQISGARQTLLCAVAWIEYVKEFQGSTSIHLVNTYQDLFQASLRAVYSCPHGSVALAAAHVLLPIIDASQSAQPNAPQDSVYSVIASAMVASVANLQACIAAKKWECVLAFIEVLNQIAAADPAWIASPERGACCPPPAGTSLNSFPFACAASDAATIQGGNPATIQGVPIGLGVLLGDVALQVACAPDFTALDDAVDVCSNIGYLEMGSRHPYFKSVAFRQLALATASQCIDASGSVSNAAGRAWDGDRWAGFRRLRVPDVMSDCIVALQGGAVRCLFELITPPSSPTTALLLKALPAHVQAVDASSRLEAIVHCLTGVASDVCELIDDEQVEDYIGTSSGNSSASVDGSTVSERIAALMLLVTAKPARDIPPLLASTTCKWIARMKPWLSKIRASDTIRHSQDPPFSNGGSLSSAAPDAGISSSIALIPAPEFFTAILRFLLSALECVGQQQGFVTAKQLVAGSSVAAALRALGGRHKSDDDGDDSEDGDDEDKDDDSGADPDEVAGGVANSACSALMHLVPAFSNAIRAEDMLQVLIRAVDSAADSGLPVRSIGSVTQAVIKVCGRIEDPSSRQEYLQDALRRHITVIKRACDAAVRLPESQQLSTVMLSSAACSLVTIVGILRYVPRADLMDGDGGMGYAGGVSAQMMLFAGESVWQQGLEVLLARVHAKHDMVTIILEFITQAIRLFPSMLNEQRIGSTLNTMVGIYRSHLYAGALNVIEEIVNAVVRLSSNASSSSIHPAGAASASDSSASTNSLEAAHRSGGPRSTVAIAGSSLAPPPIPSLAPTVIQSFHGLLVAIQAPTLESALRVHPKNKAHRPPPLCECEDAVAAFYVLHCRLLVACPQAVIAKDVLPCPIQLLSSVMKLGHRTSAIEACKFIELLMYASGLPCRTPPAIILPVYMSEAAWSCLQENAMHVGMAIAVVLTQDIGENLGALAIDLFSKVLSSRMGSAVAEGVAQGIEASAAELLRSEMESNAGRPDALMRLQQAASDGSALEEESGLLCLSKADRRAVVAKAVQCLLGAGGPVHGHAASPASPGLAHPSPASSPQHLQLQQPSVVIDLTGPDTETLDTRRSTGGIAPSSSRVGGAAAGSGGLRFRMLLDDFSKICRRQLGRDALVAHMMPGR